MGPTCEILLPVDDGETLDAIDRILSAVAEQVERTRKGRVWSIWVRGRPVDVRVTGSPPALALSAGCNQPEDCAVLHDLAAALAHAAGGIPAEPRDQPPTGILHTR